MTIQLDPGYLPDAQNQIYSTTYINVVDDATGSNVIVNVANVVNVSFSTSQPNVIMNVSSNRIWVNGAYTLGNTSNIMWFDAPYGSALANTPNVAFSFNDVPPGKFIYAVNESRTTGLTVTLNFTANYTAGGNANFSIDRYVTPNLNAPYNFLRNYSWYSV